LLHSGLLDVCKNSKSLFVILTFLPSYSGNEFLLIGIEGAADVKHNEEKSITETNSNKRGVYCLEADV